MGLHKLGKSFSPPFSTFEDQIATDSTEEDEIEELVTEIKDWQITHGSLLKLIRSETASTVNARPVGVSLFPIPMHRHDFEEATGLQSIFNKLYMHAAADFQWLSGVLSPLIEHDDLCRTLWEILLETRKASPVQDLVCGVFRSDYMLESSGIKQVEMNTFSIAGACHAQRIADMHLSLGRRRPPLNDQVADSSSSKIPRSDNTASIVNLLTEAHRLYKTSSPNPACVLMIVQPFNFNIADERPIEYGLWDSAVPCYRCEWNAALDSCSVASNRALLFRTGTQLYEVSVVYYRAGYDAAEYHAGGKQVRLRLELSRAIKCPDIATHLTTLKVVQEALTRPGAVERFLPTKQAERIRQTFVPMQVLDISPAGQAARKRALDPATAKDYVLKPNLEGGGHNIYREDVPIFLSALPEEEWQKYILMRCIEPIEHDAHLMLADELFKGPVVSELGVIGTCLWQREGTSVKALTNLMAGCTFKSKPATVDEMSVVKGYGCFSTPFLIDSEN